MHKILTYMLCLFKAIACTVRLWVVGCVALLSATAGLTQICHAPGINVGGVVSGVVNSYYRPSSSLTVGASSIPLGSLRAGGGPAVAAGDLLLIIQMQGATFNNSNTNCYGDGGGSCANSLTTVDAARGYTGTPVAGLYEYARVTTVSGGIATLASGLLNAYSLAAPTVSGTNASGSQTFQIVRVPQYPAISIDSAAPVTPLPWDGQTGGVLAMDVAGSSTFSGAGTHLTATGYGFRGGWGALGTFVTGITDYARASDPLGGNFDTTKGEGIAGTPRFVFSSLLNAGTTTGTTDGYPGGDFGRGAPANAGGGGQQTNSGGGGGGNGGRGGNGGFTWSGDGSRDAGAMGAAAFPQTGVAVASALVMGGGGGAGDLNGGGAEPVNESVGASGGGLIFFSSASVVGTGRFAANGANGADGACDGGGGGGAGGSVRVSVGSGITNLQVSARGGAGGGQTGCTNHGSAAGGGGGGVIVSNAALVSALVTPGAAGVDISGSIWNGEIGAAGQTLPAAASIWPGWSPGYQCLPLLSVVKTALSPTVTAVTAATASYNIRVINATTAGAARNVEVLDQSLPPGWTYLSTDSISYTPAPPPAAGVFAAGADTALNAPGYTVGAAPASAPAAGTNSPAWGTFFMPPGGQIDINFTALVANTATVGTYHNPSGVRFVDPSTTVTQKVTPAAQNGANRLGVTYGSAGVCTTVGACNYAVGGAVGGANHSGLEAGPSSDNVTLPVDWTISKALVGSAIAGQTGSYQVTPRNSGRAIAAQIFATSQATTVLAANIPTQLTSNPLRITDTLPTGVSITAPATGTNWTCNNLGAGAAFACNYFAAAPASAYPVAALTNLPTVTAVVTFLQTACPVPLLNTAVIAQGALEQQSLNNTTTLTSAISCSANVAITKSNSTTTVVAGGTTSYTITVSNAGPASADGARLADPAAAGLACTAVSCDPASTTGGAICPSPLTLALLQTPPGVVLPSLPASSSVTLKLECTVTATGIP
jgi:uncharacterized repeat protein (TIGR01451 family)